MVLTNLTSGVTIKHMERETKPKPEISDSIRLGVYVNFFGVSVNPERVVIDFGNVLPGPGEATSERNIIVSRVITSKGGAQKLADLINKVIRDSESTTSTQET